MTDTDVSRPLNDALAALRAGRFAEVEAPARAVLEADPGHPHALHALGLALAQLQRMEEGVLCLRQSVEALPDAAGYHANLAAALWDTGHSADALRHMDRAVALEPTNGQAWQAYAEALMEAGDAAAAIHAYASAAKFLPRSAALRSRMLRALVHDPPSEAGAVARVHQAFGKAVADATTFVAHPNPPIPDRTLRVGYLLSTLTTLAPFVEPILARHDPDQVEAVVYVEGDAPAGALARLREQVTRYRQVGGLSNADLAAAIRADEVDILVDLAGHIGRRAALLAQPLAPVQLGYLGSPVATGLRTLHHRITDAVATPPGPRDEHESPLRLSPGAWTYRPPRALPEPGPLPMLTSRHVTFGVLAPVACMTPSAIALWGRAAAAIENAHLLIHLDTPAHQAAGERVRKLLEPTGVNMANVAFHCAADRLPLYERIDIVLDAFPLSCPATVCEAMWMGVPTVALAEGGQVDQVSAALLASAGLAEHVAHDPADFLAIASRLASAPVQLAALRRTQRQRLRSSELLKEASLTRRLERAYRAVWRGWCEGQGVASGTVFETPAPVAPPKPGTSFFDEIPYNAG